MTAQHTMLIATELTTEDLLEILTVQAKKVTYQRDDAIKTAKSWKHELDMYRDAWLREMGGTIIAKSHDIDGFVLRARQIYQQAQRWIAYENGILNRDPFWMVPEPLEPTQESSR